MPTRQDALRDLLARNGKDADLADALIRIDNVVQNWRRQMHKRELGHRATRALGLDLDLAQIDVLFAIATPWLSSEPNADDETMVSTVAERLYIDPSRASRLVAEMVNSGYARRAVSQRDARRTILELTPAGEAVIEAVRGYKWLLLGEFFSAWPAEEILAFVKLFERYSSWMNSSEEAEEKYADEIATLARSIERAKAEVASGSKSG
ncbi:MarR family winged helix-turn-helix transcriptional regulator [Pelagibacterium halotolerans]|uniref:Transcriptional regulator, MarR family n=1 Tax=Pelagibacterium halotolerans (strain DSM 22347 / JCM 15775 / CGMCC 1.7692 / B2) TaxID=1082931 RepID=G4RGL8_PELHB|nr:MarR family winged helix-turn-helix transcriptional regulator [Pelagibacterium halotolerans]AEQ51077.1 transcriptional regulator, MarR family [Pelagibacterium halotolerans B2]QJR19040.1 winged helix-turn-helix transcriptional regulator [Pelagibacterium halotolerans]SEA04104.1 DNA-binding transcriptional regulator, MarR family [Pelagibacterium halotolerans]